MPLHKILIADDDPDDIELLTDAIIRHGFVSKIDTVRDGRQLLTYLYESAEIPDLLILDLRMPCYTGMDCLHLIRVNEKFDDMKIIVYSSSGNHQKRQECLVLGADYFVTKVAEVPELMKLGEAISSGNLGLLQSV
jgi:CheY-like chemotaxis protein